MNADSTYAMAADVVLLLVGLGIAAVSDFREREVADELWQVLAVGGFVVGFVPVAYGGVVPTVLWAVVGLFVLQHLFAWDALLGERGEPFADWIEIVVYGIVIALVATAIAHYGLGPSGVPVTVLAVLVGTVFARALFEGGVLYGGADAKGLMVAGLLVPLFTAPFLSSSSPAAVVSQDLPFSVNVLTNAALFSTVVPLAIAIHNVRKGEFRGVPGFLGYSIPVEELPRRFVWVRDPTFGEAREEESHIETSEDDRKHREKVAAELSAKGVRKIWVTPQIPFVVLLCLGAVAALLVGNVVFDLIFLL